MDILVKQYYLFNKNKELVNKIIDEKIMVYTNISKLNINFKNDIKLENLVWKYNENNLRIPYIDNNKLLF